MSLTDKLPEHIEKEMKRLREIEMRYRNITEYAKDIIYSHDLNGRYTSLNKAGQEITGYTAEEVMMLDMQNVIAPEYLEPTRQRISDKLNGAELSNYEVEIIAKNGRRIFIEANSWVVYKDGRPYEVQGIARDISERKRAAEALMFQKALLESQSEASLDGIMTVIDSGEILSYNNRFVEMWEIPEEVMASRSDVAALQYVESKLLNPEEFIRTVRNVYTRPETTSHEEVQLLDGRTFERYSAPIKTPENVYYGRVWYFRDITIRKQTEQQMQHDAFHDALTGLANRALLMHHLQKLIRESHSNPDEIYGVLFLDCDRFKLINDSLGHAVGDILLQQIASRLELCVRAHDTVGRIGGDEFVVLLTGLTKESDATHIADRILQALKDPFDLNDNHFFISASIGITLSTTRHKTAEEILRDADIAMYRAKANGKARYQVFDLKMHKDAEWQLELETEMRYALERGEFRVHYQPILKLENERLIGFESLVRWQHRERGMISPMEFIPAAEENGLIIPLGNWILQESCRQLRQWKDNNPEITEDLGISVNLSSKQFVQFDLAEQITTTLQTYNLDPHCLKLEITESHIMENSELAVAIMKRLRALGVHISLDDFGTGYSSLSYLHRLPASFLKIDRSFVSNMLDSKDNDEIVRIITKLARNLRMKVVAEGIETAEQLERLKELNCEFGQGYFFARPLEADKAEKFILENSQVLAC